MRRSSTFAIAVFALTFVLAASDWRWFHHETGGDYHSAMLTHSQVYPVSLMHRQKLLQQIELPDPPADLPTSALLALAAHPDEIEHRPAPEPLPGRLPDSDPLYAFMSLQR